MYSRLNPLLTVAALGVLVTSEVVTTIVYTAQAMSLDVADDF